MDFSKSFSSSSASASDGEQSAEIIYTSSFTGGSNASGSSRVLSSHSSKLVEKSKYFRKVFSNILEMERQKPLVAHRSSASSASLSPMTVMAKKRRQRRRKRERQRRKNRKLKQQEKQQQEQQQKQQDQNISISSNTDDKNANKNFFDQAKSNVFSHDDANEILDTTSDDSIITMSPPNFDSKSSQELAATEATTKDRLKQSKSVETLCKSAFSYLRNRDDNHEVNRTNMATEKCSQMTKLEQRNNQELDLAAMKDKQEVEKEDKEEEQLKKIQQATPEIDIIPATTTTTTTTTTTLGQESTNENQNEDVETVNDREASTSSKKTLENEEKSEKSASSSSSNTFDLHRQFFEQQQAFFRSISADENENYEHHMRIADNVDNDNDNDIFDHASMKSCFDSIENERQLFDRQRELRQMQQALLDAKQKKTKKRADDKNSKKQEIENNLSSKMESNFAANSSTIPTVPAGAILDRCDSFSRLIQSTAITSAANEEAPRNASFFTALICSLIMVLVIRFL